MNGLAEYPPSPLQHTSCYSAEQHEIRAFAKMMIDVHDASGRPEEAKFKSDLLGLAPTYLDTELATIPALVSGCVLFQGCGPESKICRP